jgi:hypothetical protein
VLPLPIVQASPYVVFFFLVPVHYFTHLGMIFFTAIWYELLPFACAFLPPFTF